ncbi:MAG: nitroreductase [Gammaproteobacteria bacterium]|nr:nitroreductase [Gammaproteobacteria bacterium]
MNVDDAIIQRHSTRSFLNKDVTIEQISHILEIASHSPSGANSQPWQVAILSGDSKKQLQAKLEFAFSTGTKPNPDYQYYPKTWNEPYHSRRIKCGLQLYQSLTINKEDIEQRQAQWQANYRAFDAPVMLLFFMDDVMETGSYLDCGMFMQSLMLAAMQQGLATCPQAALSDYPDVVKQELGYATGVKLIAGMALGYEDTNATVNAYRTSREPSSSFCHFFN